MNKLNDIVPKKGEKRFWGRIFIHTFEQSYPNIANQAESVLADFFRQYTPINKKRVFFFNIIIQRSPDFYFHNDNFHAYYGPNSSLDCHFDFDTFANASHYERLAYILGASCLLLRHWYAFYPKPKDFDLLDFITKLELFLSERNILIIKHEAFIKPTNNLTFKFITTTGATVTTPFYDLNTIEYFINKKLNQFSFGESVHKIQFGYELFSRTGLVPYPHSIDNDYILYGKDWRRLVIARFFNSDLMQIQSPLEQLNYLNERISSGFYLLKTFNKLPNDFDVNNSHDVINQAIHEYILLSIASNFDNEKIKSRIIPSDS